MVARKRWRYLAPVALLAVIVATLLVLRAGLAKHDKLPATPPVALTTIHRPHARKRFYVIKPGDSLSAISAALSGLLKSKEATPVEASASMNIIGV